jgi:hypothetical protein
MLTFYLIHESITLTRYLAQIKHSIEMSMLINFTTEDKPKPEPAPAHSSNKPVKRKRQKPPSTSVEHERNKGTGIISKEIKDGDKTKSSHLSSSLFTSNPAIPNIQTETKKTDSSDVLFEISSFDTLDISSNIKGNLKTEFKCETMTKVQKLAIPAVLSKRDVQVGCAYFIQNLKVCLLFMCLLLKLCFVYFTPQCRLIL